MRVLIATSHRNTVGGVEKYIQALIPELASRGHAVALVYQYATNEFDRIDSVAPALPAWCSGELGQAATLDAIRAWSPDVVYSQGLADFSLDSALASRYAAVLYAHTYLGTCVSGRKCLSKPQPRPCERQLGLACLVHYYPHRCGGLHPGTMWRMFREQSLRRASFARYRFVLTASRHMRSEYERHGAPNVQLLPLPVTQGIPDPGPPVHRAPQGRILFMGRLMDVKGPGYLIRAIPQVARRLGTTVTLTAAGLGPELSRMKDLAAQCNVSVNLSGWLDARQKLELIRQSDLLAVPSLWPEPFGLVGIEAGMLGVPAAAYAAGGIPDWLVPGVTGELAPANPPTVAGLAEAMVRVLAEPAHYNKLRHGSWVSARQFTMARHMEGLEAVLAAAAKTPVAAVPVALNS